ncbi:unnamed protein product, partial [Gongylonema pulchrum]|uniref:Sema domain-containing protein n=1 Tax=Gongylonema pulchrum TaxID=637853 RepID=A0A183ENB4_9BILA
MSISQILYCCWVSWSFLTHRCFFSSEPNFVASFSIGKFVYFFFREIAIEHESCGRVVYSRVARICKKDIGGKNVLRQVWTSFVKARLDCSTSSSSPTFFNEIQSLQRVDGQSDTLFYATLTTPDISFGGSAVCAFSLNAINQLFDHGSFMEQTSPDGSWFVTPSENVPKHRPGTCSPNSASLPDSDLHFARSHLLMAGSVPGGRPLLVLHNELLTYIAVDPLSDVNCSPNSASLADSDLHFARSHLLMAGSVPGGRPLLVLHNELLTYIAVDPLSDVNVIFAYSQSSARLYKIAHWFEGADNKAKLLATYTLKLSGNVHAMTLLPGEFLYVASTDAVSQYLLTHC